MIRSNELANLAVKGLAEGGEPEAEIVLRASRRGCARFSISELSQHMLLDEIDARIRVAKGTRVAEVRINVEDPKSLADGIKHAAVLAESAPELDGFDGFAAEGPETPEVPRYDHATLLFDEEQRTDIAAWIMSRIATEKLVSAGMLETSATATAIATTRWCVRAHDATRAELRVWALEDAAGRGASGHGSHLVRDVGSLDVARVVEEAIRFAKDGKDPKSVDAGTWNVVMEPVAVAELLEWLSSITFGAAEVEQGTSAFSGALGKRVTGEAVTIVEDPLDASERGFGEPFDREGTPRQRVPLIEHGVASAVLYDRVRGARAGKPSTGSAVIPTFGATMGVGAVAVQLEGGAAESVDELIAGMKRGLYIRRLHYVNGYLETKRAVMTGLARDGCFLVENGKIVSPVGNVRLTDSFLEMLGRADAMTKARHATTASWVDGGVLVTPAIRMRDVRITSGSKR